jgi:hypothetical protein
VPYRWTPPPGFASLEHNGKTYLPGQMVPISKHDAEHMMRVSAHVFEGLELPEPMPPTIAPNVPTPKGD